MYILLVLLPSYRTNTYVRMYDRVQTLQLGGKSEKDAGAGAVECGDQLFSSLQQEIDDKRFATHVSIFLPFDDAASPTLWPKWK